jgi:1-acyl-sn-glycerol-3-phosphate acyltransferase
MAESSENLAALGDPSPVRHLIIGQVENFLASYDPERAALAKERVESVLANAEPAELWRLLQRMTSTGSDWEYQRSDPLARRLSHVLGALVFEPGSALLGAEHLQDTTRAPVTFLVNHLSFSDANVLECLLVFSGFEAVADRLTVLVGPKVFTDSYRRLMSLCFGSIKTPQSSSRATGEAVMSKRAIAAAAASTLEHFEARRGAGDNLLIFVEGSRSRTQAMQPALPAVSRYIESPDVVLLPVGISGSERLVPIGEERVRATRVVARVGAPIHTALLWQRTHAKRRLLMDVVGLKIAALLPPEYRGVYADDAPGLEDGRRIAEAV